ncbi:MAG: hypothetical protein LBH75_05810 [Treponema sp.]|jgi:hypothetical protein|nr:hypothetical protein [Treponema sp.]
MRMIEIVGVCVVMLFCTCSSSAREDNLQRALGINTEAVSPVFLGCSAVSSTEILFRFSLPVSIVSVKFEPVLEIASIENGETVTVHLNDDVSGGNPITANVLVEDSNKNTLHVLVSFRSRNERLPSFLITEIRTETAKPKGEFVELKMLEDGNLCALRMFTATNSMEIPFFEFPSIEVKKGDYVVIHLRTYEENATNETSRDKTASKAKDSSDTAWDLWLPDSTERLRKTDAVFLMDQDDNIVDAVVFSADDTWGTKTNSENIERALVLLRKQGAWLFESEDVFAPSDAFSSANTTTTRTICRNETLSDLNAASDWYITASSGATPGRPNNPVRYTAKKK